jgi:hypothetical protein
MSRSLDQIVAELWVLTADDFDYNNVEMRGPERLQAVCAEVLKLPVPHAVFPEIFRLMERLSDSDLGSPGPLVHTMEEHIGCYEGSLVASIRRKPTRLTVWMVNRILNGSAPEKETWMNLLSLAAEHPAASEATKSEARRLIAFQFRK